MPRSSAWACACATSVAFPVGGRRCFLWPQDVPEPPQQPRRVSGVPAVHFPASHRRHASPWGGLDGRRRPSRNPAASCGRRLSQQLTRSLRKLATVPLYAVSYDGTESQRQGRRLGDADSRQRRGVPPPMARRSGGVPTLERRHPARPLIGMSVHRSRQIRSLHEVARNHGDTSGAGRLCGVLDAPAATRSPHKGSRRGEQCAHRQLRTRRGRSGCSLRHKSWRRTARRGPARCVMLRGVLRLAAFVTVCGLLVSCAEQPDQPTAAQETAYQQRLPPTDEPVEYFCTPTAGFNRSVSAASGGIRSRLMATKKTSTTTSGER